MKDRYIPAIIMLFAGAVTCISDIINKVDLMSSLKRLLLVLVIFYIIGIIARSVILKAISMKPKVKPLETPQEGLDESTEESNNYDTVASNSKK